MTITRRQFLQTSAAAGVALALPGVARARGRAANDEIRLGVVGLGIRGSRTHIPRMQGQKGVRVVAICDPDRERLAKAAAHIEREYGHKPRQFVDIRKMLEVKDLDAVTIATMQYWHSLGTIWACQAGKHVYCEKPLAHYIWEGRQMVNAARKYDRLVQVGTQSRSEGSCLEAIAWIRAGNLGKIKHVTCFANKPRCSIGKRSTPLPIPDFVDYELWCGPARKEPIYRDRLQYDCSFIWNMGDGESCNQGVHEMDVARWLLGETQLPRRVISIGGRFCFHDAGEVPNTQIIYYDFPSCPVLYETHNMMAAKGSSQMPDFRGVHVDTCVNCEGGYVMVRSGLVFDTKGRKIKTFPRGETHFENFIAAVRSGRRADLHADVLEGHLSTAVCHAGNTSYRLGKPASRAEIREQVKEVPLLADAFERLVKHLQAHEVDVDQKAITLGPWLECDRPNECFKDSAEANRLVRGFYREPFGVPEIAPDRPA